MPVSFPPAEPIASVVGLAILVQADLAKAFAAVLSKPELIKISQIASNLKINSVDFESIQAMFVKEENSAYKILEIGPKSSIEDIKKAYRIMVKKYHPDKLQTKDPYLLKGAEEKFIQVQNAYETLKNKHKF